jgi:hypothetical protein
VFQVLKEFPHRVQNTEFRAVLHGTDPSRTAQWRDALRQYPEDVKDAIAMLRVAYQQKRKLSTRAYNCLKNIGIPRENITIDFVRELVLRGELSIRDLPKHMGKKTYAELLAWCELPIHTKTSSILVPYAPTESVFLANAKTVWKYAHAADSKRRAVRLERERDDGSFRVIPPSLDQLSRSYEQMFGKKER